jgi:D-alanyl-lipoteichoic acid acyltransferase DltB (MBOAT superfamily)
MQSSWFGATQLKLHENKVIEFIGFLGISYVTFKSVQLLMEIRDCVAPNHELCMTLTTTNGNIDKTITTKNLLNVLFFNFILYILWQVAIIMFYWKSRAKNNTFSKFFVVIVLSISITLFSCNFNCVAPNHELCMTLTTTNGNIDKTITLLEITCKK